MVVCTDTANPFDAAKTFTAAAFMDAPRIEAAESFEPAIELAKAAGKILLLPHIAHPYVGDIETHARWQTMHGYTFHLPFFAPHKRMEIIWLPFRWQE